MIKFEDENHITEIWTWKQGGMDMPMVFRLTRRARQTAESSWFALPATG
jgi:hypothetical protein